MGRTATTGEFKDGSFKIKLTTSDMVSKYSVYFKEDKIRIVLDNLKVHTSEATRKYLVTVPERFEFVFTPKHGSWLNMVEGFFSKTTRQMLRGIRVKFKEELTNRIYRYFAEINEEPIVFHGNIISMILMYRKKSLLIHCLSKSRVN